MSADETAVPAVETALWGDVRIECYVRSGIPGAVSRHVGTLVDRLRTLADRDTVADVRVDQWPSRHAFADEPSRTRNDLVVEFERWADRRGYSLEPAFRRQEVPTSPLGLDDEARERVRVPLLALALYGADDRLRGVVPYTDHPQPDEGRTYTVEQWLTAAETQAVEPPLETSSDEPTTFLRGRQ
ncbi:HTH domain-containing protein [Natrinema marinum]|uniref:HTH domain-containing protein n=1 Tax=Natrinema marinum TaxID=2961598 RepID=UPI0020C8A3FD|nr:HTH domain-containing protein [Natrinema marinum]